MAVSLGSGNSLMRLIAGVVETALIDSVSEEESVRSHRAVVDAIEAGDPAAASAAVLATIEAGAARGAPRPIVRRG